MGEMVRFKRPDAKECSGYYVKPKAGDRAPAVVVIQEWWGLNDQIKGVAERFAGLGYRALVPDLYRGKLTVEREEANHLMSNLDFGDAAKQDIAGAVQHLGKAGARVGVVGFCMGGALTVLSAAFVKGLAAASSWYGFPPEGAADLTKIKLPIQFHFASQDAFFTPEAARLLEARLEAGKIKFESWWYPASHAFGNEKGENYDAVAAKLAWQRTVEFFGKHLK